MKELLNHYGLAELLNVSSQSIKEKILRHKRIELEKYGKIDINNGVIELNVDQVLYIVFNMNVNAVDIETKIAFIKALFCYDKEEPKEIVYQQVVEQMPVELITPSTKNSDYDKFCKKLSH